MSNGKTYHSLVGNLNYIRLLFFFWSAGLFICSSHFILFLFEVEGVNECWWLSVKIEFLQS